MKTLETYLQEFDKLFTVQWDKHDSWKDFGEALSPEQVRGFLATMYREVREETVRETIKSISKLKEEKVLF